MEKTTTTARNELSAGRRRDNGDRVQVFAKALQVVLWTATFLVALAWLLRWKLPFEAEPITALLGLVSVATTTLVTHFNNVLRAREDDLEEEKFSAPLALAHGYVHNFVEPLVTRLMQQAGKSAEDVRLYILIPDELADLEPAAVERTIARIRAKQFATKTVNLQFDQGRPRDVLTVMKGGDKTVYFDFPNTLLTLKPVVDYKVRAPADTSLEQAKRELGAKFIWRFKKSVEEMLARKRLTDYVKLTDKNLGFLE